MKGANILILGGGVGGIVAANHLRRLLPQEHTITVMERRDSFFLGATKTWVMMGDRQPEEITRPLKPLESRGIRLVRAEIRHIDTEKREVRTDEGTLKGDILIVALGAALNMHAFEGLHEAAHTFYTMEGAVRLRDVLKNFAGGDVVILNPRMPIQCPPAPYEAAMLLQHHFKLSGMEDKARVSMLTVEPNPMPTAGPEVSQIIREALKERHIELQTNKKTKSVDGNRRRVVFEDGTEAPYDLLIAIPPHEAPQVIRESGLLNASGWITVDPKTLKTSVENVFAVGDVTSVPLPGRYRPDVPLVLPKAAVMADAQARVAAENIAAMIMGIEPKASFDGKGFCYVEMGGGHAMGGKGSFFELPQPRVEPRVPDMNQFEEKRQWVEKWMTENL